ncbi:MAG: hypothetical protein ACKVPY_05485 [Paracoccaceae bacterium]
MQKLPVVIGALALMSLAGCLQNDGERAAVGAVGGAVVADALGGNAVTGAVIGGGLGYFCDELNLPGCTNR